VEALRLRNQLDPKRFYKKEEGEGRGIKGLPKFIAVRFALPMFQPVSVLMISHRSDWYSHTIIHAIRNCQH
jgi:hypothetical protein